MTEADARVNFAMLHLLKARLKSGVGALAKAIADRIPIIVAAVVGRGRHRALGIVYLSAGQIGIAKIGSFWRARVNQRQRIELCRPRRRNLT